MKSFKIHVVHLSAIIIAITAGCNQSTLPLLQKQITPTITPTSQPCAWEWGRTELPELSLKWQNGLDTEKITYSKAEAFGFGEGCIYPDPNKPKGYAILEVNFLATASVDDLEDKNSLGNIAEKALIIVEAFPDNYRVPMMIEITFLQPDGKTKEIRFHASPSYNQWHGAELYQALENSH